jgi:transglutaminase-like putative cysteine protease
LRVIRLQGNSLPLLRIDHKTVYRYERPVGFWPHRLMLRPRESRELRVISTELTIAPTAVVTWAQDVYGNAVATANFHAAAATLEIDSVVHIELNSVAWPVFDIAAAAIRFPFQYSHDDKADLGALAIPQYPDSADRLRVWAWNFVRGKSTDTLALLKDLSAGISQWICYESREDEGTQLPASTLDRGRGSCRDFALLFVEAVRSLGLGARIVSGYLYSAGQAAVGNSGSGTTHAWAEVYVPGAGWISFDPTNRSVGGSNLIPVAVARDIGQVTPVSGTFVGQADAFAGLSVTVQVTNSASD